MSKTSATKGHGTIASYSVGFVLSIILTLAAYWLVVEEALESWTLIWTILLLAVAQLYVQLHFFLHMSSERKPRWNMWAFWFMVGVVMIIVLGSLWIMQNLDYHHHNLSPQQIDSQLLEEEGLQP